MTKTLAVLGVGQGWSYQVAKKYALEGYQVALVSRTQSRLEALSTKLQSEVPKSANKVKIFTADLFVPENVNKVVADILKTYGSIDVVYSGVVSSDMGFVSANKLTVEQAQQNVHMFFYSAITLVQAVLPSMQARKSGAIVFGAGSSASKPYPHMSGPGPAMAALRLYLLTLNLELKDSGIFVGLVMVGALILGSQSGEEKKDVFPHFPRVEASALGEIVFELVQKQEPERIVF